MVSSEISRVTKFLTNSEATWVTGLAERRMVRASIPTFRLDVRDIEISVNELLVEVGEAVP